jgi:hypothetical protein
MASWEQVILFQLLDTLSWTQSSFKDRYGMRILRVILGRDARATFQGKGARLSALELYSETYGRGDPLPCIHGFGASPSCRNFIEPFAHEKI